MITGPASEAHRQHGRGSLWGVRAEESHGRRMLYRRSLAAETRARQQSPRGDVRAEAGGVVHRADGTITYGPIWDWQRTHVFEYLAGRGIEPNPLYCKLAALGVAEARIRVDSIVCCRALKLATMPSLSMHMRHGVVRRRDEGVLDMMMVPRLQRGIGGH